MRARYYNANQGRFFQEDTYLGNIIDPLALNRYAYGKNSPMNYVDPSGHMSETMLTLLKEWFINETITAEDLAKKALSENGKGAIYTAFHEIAQLYAAKRLFENGFTPFVELHVERAGKLTANNTTRCYEADIIAWKLPYAQPFAWEVKPITWYLSNSKMNTANSKFKDMLVSDPNMIMLPGPQGAVGFIDNIPIIGKIKMAVMESAIYPGFLFYGLYYQGNSEERVWVTNAEAAVVVKKHLDVSEAIINYVFTAVTVTIGADSITTTSEFARQYGAEALSLLARLVPAG